MWQTIFFFILSISCNQILGQKFVDLYESENYLKSYEQCKKIVAKDKTNYKAYLYRSLNQIKIASDTSNKNNYNYYFEQSLFAIDFIQTKSDGKNYLVHHQSEQKFIEDACYYKAINLIDAGEIKIAERIVHALLEVNELPEYHYLNALIKDAQGFYDQGLVIRNTIASEIYLGCKAGRIKEPYLPHVFLELAEGIYQNGDKYSTWVILTRALNLFRTESIFEFSVQLLSTDVFHSQNQDDSMFINDLNFIDTLRKFEMNSALDDIEFNILKSWLFFQNGSLNSNPESIIQKYICPSPIFIEKFKKIYLENQFSSIDKNGVPYIGNSYPLNKAYLVLLLNCSTIQSQSLETFLVQTIHENLDKDSILNAARTYAVLKNDCPKSTQLIATEKMIAESLKKLYIAGSDYFLCKAVASYCGSAAMNKIMVSDISNQMSKLIQAKKFTEADILIKNAYSLKPEDSEIQYLYKKWVIDDYNLNFDCPNYKELYHFNTDIKNCDPGKLTENQQAYFLQTLNYVRRLVGIYQPCKLDEKLNAKCQQAALMMEANYDLSHFPTKDWSCFTPDGASAAGTSNLSLGYSYVYALVGQLEDDGEGNESVGHRRWILNPYNSIFGHGSTESAMALCVFGTSDYYLQQSKTVENKFFVWPPAGFVPENFICNRWSISYKYGDFSNAKIEVKVDGNKIPIEILEISSGYGLNTIVFVIPPQWLDKNYIYNVQITHVQIDDVQTPLEFNYSVQFIDTRQ